MIVVGERAVGLSLSLVLDMLLLEERDIVCSFPPPFPSGLNLEGNDGVLQVAKKRAQRHDILEGRAASLGRLCEVADQRLDRGNLPPSKTSTFNHVAGVTISLEILDFQASVSSRSIEENVEANANRGDKRQISWVGLYNRKTNVEVVKGAGSSSLKICLLSCKTP